LTNCTGLPISTGLSGLTTNGVAYATSTSALATGSTLGFDGTNLYLGTTSNSTFVSGTNYVMNATTGLANKLSFTVNNSAVSYVYANASATAIGYPSGGSLQFQIVGGGTVGTFNSSGYLGIGTNSPSAPLTVVGSTGITVNEDGASTHVLSLRSNYAGTGPTINVTTNETLQFATNNTLQMYLNASGNLGLGVTPSAWYANSKVIQVGNGGALEARNNNALFAISSNNYINTSGNYTYIATDYATRYNQTNGTHIWQVAPSGTAGNAISFTQAMTLDSSGNLLVGTTSSLIGTVSGTIQCKCPSGNNSALFQSSASSGNVYGPFIYFTGQSPNNSTSYFLQCADSTATARMQVNSNGGIANYSANNVNLSDATMKKDITPAKSYLSILNQIPVVTFLLNDQTDTDLNLGVTAQSVQAVAPELVGTMDVGTKEAPNVKLAIYETDFKYAMLKAIQELSAQVTELKAEVATLKGA